MGYLLGKPCKTNPLGLLGKMEMMEAYRYDPASDSWKRWEYGDALLWGQGPWDKWDFIDQEEGEFLRYELQVAHALTLCSGGDDLQGWHYRCVKAHEEEVRKAYERGVSPAETAADIACKC